MDLETIQNLSFEIISEASNARNSFQQGIEASKEFDFEKAESLIKEGSKQLATASGKHFSVIQEEANGESLPFSVLFMHAEDQLVMTEIKRDSAKELLDVYKKIMEMKG